jgi:hypothetical protein
MNNMVKITICAVALLVSGCSKTPTDEQYKKAHTWCDTFGGAKTVTFGEISGLRVRCTDGKLIIKDTSS